MKTPKGCKTPNRDCEEYALKSADIRFIENAANQIWDMITYYANMPENRTGEIVVKDANAEKLDKLQTLITDIATAIDEIRYTD